MNNFLPKLGFIGNIGYIKTEDIEFNNGNGYISGNILVNRQNEGSLGARYCDLLGNRNRMAKVCQIFDSINTI